MKKYLILLGVLLLMQSKIIAQNENDRAFIIEQTNTEVLNDIMEKNISEKSHSLKVIQQKTPFPTPSLRC
jgi:hypothetical protein|tara:strand:- start:199 stop:408 length:210 start_codon:yes stop_codon:yes gene_type:complete